MSLERANLKQQSLYFDQILKQENHFTLGYQKYEVESTVLIKYIVHIISTIQLKKIDCYFKSLIIEIMIKKSNN